MTVTATSATSGPFTPNGATTVFPFTFAALAADQVKVVRRDSDGVDTVVSGYSVSLTAGSGGSITFSDPPLSGDPLYIFSDPDFDQQVDLANQGAFSPTALNAGFDAGAVRDIYLKNGVERSLRLPSGEAIDELPGAGVRASTFLTFDSSGDFVLATASEAAAIFANATGAIFDGSWTDEYGTTYVMGVRSGALTPVMVPNIYIDPVNGSDANNGLTRATALKTSAGLLAHPLMGPPGADVNNPAIVRGLGIGIVGHPTHIIRDQFDFYLQNSTNGFRQMHACTFTAVGRGPVHFDCTDVATTFTAHGSIANAWTKSWTHAINGGSGSRVRVYSNGRPLKRVQNEADVAAGKYWTNGNPIFGAPLGITFIDFGSGNPNSNGHVIEITARDVAISMRSGRVAGIWAERNGHNNGAIYMFDGQSDGGVVGDVASELRSCLLYEGTKHHAVIGHGVVSDCAFVNSIDDEYFHDGSLPAYLAAFEDDFGGKTFTARRCYKIADQTLWGAGVGVGQVNADPFLVHDTNVGGGPSSLAMEDCSVVGLFGTISLGLARTAQVTGLYSPGTPTGSVNNPIVTGSLTDPYPLTVSRSFLGGADRWISGLHLTVTSNLLISSRTFSGGGITTVNVDGYIDAENNLFIASNSQDAPFVDLTGNNTTGNTLIFRRNLAIEAGGGGGQAFVVNTYVASPTVAPSITADFNLYKGNGNNYFSQVKNTARTLTTWKGTTGSPDANSLDAVTAASAGFVSGSFPTIASPDVRLTEAGAANARMTDPITQAEIDAMLARPKTYAEAQAWFATRPGMLPVVS